MSVQAEEHPKSAQHAFLRQLFAQAGYHNHLGLELEEVSLDKLSVKLHNKPELRSGHQILHGGAIASLVDAVGVFHAGVAARANISAGDTSRVFRMATIDLHLDYLRPPSGESFVASSAVVYAGSSIIRIRVEVVDDAGTLIAVASANYSY